MKSQPAQRQGTQRQETRRRWLRPLQLSLLTLAALCGGGYYALSASNGQGGGSNVVLSGSLPNFTLLLAGRDVIYCYYHQPCKDQNQRKGVIQTANTDTLMLVKVQGKRVSVLSIPRDTNVGDFDPKKSAAEQKVNGKYWDGGPQALVSAVETITGERVDNYLIVRTEEAARVIDALGGLDVNVPAGGIEWIDKAAGVNLKLAAGPHHLEGQEAVWYLRVRKGFGDDYGRIDHQKQALSQLASKLTTPGGLSAVPTILSVMNGVETNLDPTLLTTVQPVLSQFKLSFATLPTDTIRRSFNLAVNREELAKVWGNSLKAEPSSAVTILLEDASGAGLGPPMVDALHAAGYPNVRLSTLPKIGERSQVFTQSDVETAQNIADQLNLPRLQGERFPVAAGQIGVLLGGDAPQLFAALNHFTPAASSPAP
ncbi:LytR family transcriptional regulator [Deinococcus detaillensis]|uniref:LytR family transcriptional regulator n=1 Tax=Deinococcus detaillensis TaxID=2592048 RepID=A0A553V5J8_9DEIO|nr:LCP family protein [Deinococcus detaillensis]TSA87749.1 LytR family transcriptional regulator [Deinococcus detaillensis]